MMLNYKVVSIDFDGTLVENCFPEIGNPRNEVIGRYRAERTCGTKFILNTCRTDELLENALRWCKFHEIEFDAVNMNLPELIEKYGGDSRKISADEYWDDKNVILEGKRCFEFVQVAQRKNANLAFLPKKSTKNACAYDFYLADDVVLEPMKPKLIWTDVKAKFQPDEVLLINVRSSMGKVPIMMANSQGWIDCDYHGNATNDGNIGICLLNLSDATVHYVRGDRIAQGMFVKHLAATDGNVDTIREGGFGSSGK